MSLTGRTITANDSSIQGPSGDNDAPAVQLTRFTSERRLVKRYHLDDHGQLAKEPGGSMDGGSAQLLQVQSMRGFADLLGQLQSNEALTYGIHGEIQGQSYPVASRKASEQGRADPEARTRTKEEMSYPSGPAVFFLDHDPEDGKDPVQGPRLWEILCECFPKLEGHAAMLMPSSSSYLYNGEKELQGLRGQRIYFFVAEGLDIPRTMAALQTVLWAQGHGWIKLSRAGSKLERTLFDSTTAQANRFDFSRSVQTEPPIESRPPEPTLIRGLPLVNSREVFPDPGPGVVRTAGHNKSQAKSLIDGQAVQVQEEWVEEKAREDAGPEASREDLEQRKKVARRFLQTKILEPAFILTVVDGEQHRRISVEEILENKNRWHEALTLDPAEPEYQGYKVVGKLWLKQAKPALYSMAHGGQTYLLAAPRVAIPIHNGREFEALQQAADLVRDSEEIYDRGQQLVQMSPAGLTPLTAGSLGAWISQRAFLYRVVQGKENEPPSRVPVKVSDPQAKWIFEQLVQMNAAGHQVARPLEAVVNAPTMMPNGNVLQEEGYYEMEKVLLVSKGRALYPIAERERINEARVEKAVRFLLEPFEEFPLVGEVDRGVLLAALLSAVVRPGLSTCPAFAFDAPTQGSGKTLLAKCVAELAAGYAHEGLSPSVWPHITNENEVNKRLDTIAMAGHGAAIWDNILGTFDSGKMAADLTSPAVMVRPMFRQTQLYVPNRTLYLLTGNNLRLGGDMPRRVLTCRIDPQEPRPDARRFDFDPYARIASDRGRYVAAALTILQGRQGQEGSWAPSGMGSFEQWNALVREAVCWVAQRGKEGAMHDFQLDDPAKVIGDQADQDPETESLVDLIQGIRSWKGEGYANAFYAKQLKRLVDSVRRADRNDDNPPEWEEQIADTLAGWVRVLSTNNIGKQLGHRIDRVVEIEGQRFRLKRGKKEEFGLPFWVEKVGRA